jgi:hypothetical protein
MTVFLFPPRRELLHTCSDTPSGGLLRSPTAALSGDLLDQGTSDAALQTLERSFSSLLRRCLWSSRLPPRSLSRRVADRRAAPDSLAPPAGSRLAPSGSRPWTIRQPSSRVGRAFVPPGSGRRSSHRLAIQSPACLSDAFAKQVGRGGPSHWIGALPVTSPPRVLASVFQEARRPVAAKRERRPPHRPGPPPLARLIGV